MWYQGEVNERGLRDGLGITLAFDFIEIANYKADKRHGQ
jgi:hypothetical protein